MSVYVCMREIVVTNINNIIKINTIMSLNELVEKQVNVITTDGRNIVGILKGYDQVQNLILNESMERVFSETTGVIQQPLGLYIIRGDTM